MDKKSSEKRIFVLTTNRGCGNISSETRTKGVSRMAFDYSKLRGRIREKFGTEHKFAAAMGMGRVSLSGKLNNEGDFTRKQMLKAAELLQLDANDIPEYFFRPIVQKSEPA